MEWITHHFVKYKGNLKKKAKKKSLHELLKQDIR